MNFNKLTISDLIDQQLPDFVVNQFPTFVKFFEEYYKSLEISGGILDITENFLDYKNIDNLRKYNLVTTYKVQQSISTTDTSIVLDKTDGLPLKDGLIKINDEIILYGSVDLTNRTLLDCRRGFTATSSFSETNTTIEETVAAAHAVDDTVTNLSNLILFTILKNYEDQYLSGFPYENIQSEIGKDTLVRNIKDFYSYKGTDVSIEFLFRTLFDEEVTVRYPKDYVIKTSYSDWTVDDIIKVESIAGNPYTLVGNELKQTDASGKETTTAIIDQILVNNISNYASGNKNIYEIRLNVLDKEFFDIPSESILRGSLDSSSTVITVDSTIGFPELNGIIEIDNEIITYRYKTFNQFIDCVRGSYNTNSATHADLARVVTTEYLFGYSGGEKIDTNLVKMRLLGVLSTTTINDGASYYSEGERVTLTPDGADDERKQFTSWIKNESGTKASSSDVQINNNIKDITSNITAVYKDNTYAYVASTGLPSHPIGDFIGVGFDVKNQNILKTIPLETEKNTQEQFTGDRPVGLFVNGVEAFGAQDYEQVAFGGIERVDIIQKGFGFETNIQPIFRVKDSTGSNATFSATIVDGKVSSVQVTNPGLGFTSDHDLEVSYGFDAVAAVVNDTDLRNGSIQTITVTNPGQDYVATPNVEIVDTTGKGKNAYAIAEVTNNQVTGIVILNGGVDYTDKSTIQVNIISKGTGVVARAISKKWAFDRVFLTKNSRDLNNNFAPAQTIKSDTGNGYLYPSRNIRYNLQYGYPSNPKVLRHSLSDNVEGVTSGYNEKTSGFVHSPILGWAYDGNPIYGPYGYSNPVNTSSGISRQTSSYVLKTSVSADRPSTTEYPLGAFVDDYEFTQGSGSLDKNNGRFCITPDFPDGRYCYFLTVDNFGAGVYPYIIGKTFHSVPSQYNFDNEFDQSRQSNLPTTVRRIRSANTPSRGFDATLNIGSVERGSIDSFAVNSTNDSFRNLDYLYIDNTDTEGSRAFGRVEKVKGPSVPRVSYAVASGFTAPGFTTTNGIPDIPWPVDISAPQYVMMGLKYDVTVETSSPHLLSDGDTVDLSLDRAALQSSKTFKVRVSNYQTVHYNKPVIETTLVADVAFNQNTVNVTSADDYRENDYILINDEIMKVTSIDYNLDQMTVERTQFSTPLRLHAATNKVSLHIPDADPDYRIAVGDAITSPGVSGVIYSIDKANSSFEVRVVSGSLTSSSTITDSSTPSGRDVQIDSVSSTSVYWEFDPTNTGNYYVRDLQFRLVRATEYTFDLSDGSLFGFNLVFSEDSSNINTLSNVQYNGTPGTAGANVIIQKAALLNFDVSRVYYYEQNGQILNNKKYFSILSLPEGTQTITVVNDNAFKFTIPLQPENPEYLNVISYQTTSRTAIGEVADINVIDGGEGYKKLPKILGVTHTQLDDAKFTYSITNGQFDSVSVINGGSRYTNQTKIFVSSTNGTGAVLTPVVINGRITSVDIDNAGNGYEDTDSLTAVDQNAEIFAVSSSIGKVKTIRFTNNGSQFNPDYTLSKSLIFNKKVIITDIQGGEYKLAETVTTSGGLNAKIEKIQEIGVNLFLLDLKIRSGDINVGDTLTGAILQTTSNVYSITEPDVFGNISGFIQKVGFFDSDLGKLNASSQKITDSYYYQDFSYVIRSTRGLSDYKKYVDDTTHPLGFKLFGEVSVENDVDFEDTVTGAAFSIGLADDPTANEVIIQLPTVNVESDIVFKKYEVSRVNTTDLKAYGGTGAALLNFLDNQIESVQMADISADLNVNDKTYTLTTNDGDFPLGTRNTSIMLALNEVFQEPFQTGEVTAIDYAGGIATITTSGDHKLAVTSSGQTYPNQKYIHISGVTNTGNLDFNDQFEVFDVPSTTSIRVLFDNPNGYLTNNNPAVCADVQSTIDNLVSILTYQLNDPTRALPTNNNGIWLDPAESTIVSANRHRDGANLIYANKQEIIDRANAQISIDYPDFYYPNDPQTTSTSRYKDAYRLIQQNRTEIVTAAYNEIAIVHPTFVNPDPDKCQRDIGYFVDAVSLDVHTGGNVYARKFLKQYFNATGNSLISNGLSGEVLESITAFNKARDMMKLAITNQLTFQDLTITPGNAEYWGNAVGSPTLQLAPTDATYNPATGDFVMTFAAAHGVTTDEYLKLDVESFVFTCAMDGNKTEHYLPDTDQIAASQFLSIDSVTANTITVNVGASGPDLNFTPTNATYDPATGDFVITIGAHTLSIGEGIVLDDNSFTFTCDMDGDDAQKTYPRPGIDPYASKSLKITATTADSITVNVGASGPNKYFTPTGADYNPTTGDMIVTVGQHGLGVGRSVVLEDNSFTFTCALDNNATQHTYPRPGTDPFAGKSIAITSVGSTQHSPTDADYNPASGEITFTLANHGFANGDYIKIDDNAITYTCTLDGNATQHTYPRSHDYGSGRWFAISDVQTNTFKITGLPIPVDQSVHTFVAFTAGGLKRQDGTFTINVGTSSDTSAHTFVSATTNAIKHEPQSTHAFVSATANAVKHLPQSAHTFKRVTGTDVVSVYNGTGTPTNATYDPATGVSVITIADHGLSNGDQVLFRDNSFTFTCEMDGNISKKTYPRVTDGNFNTAMTVSNVTTDTFEVNVGASPLVNFDVTAADYDPESGDVELTIGAHTLSKYESIKLRDESLVFTCDLDNNATEHAYPKTTILSETIDTADYDPVNGILTVTVNNHGWEDGDFIKFDDNSVVFTCALDGNLTQHSYPRPGSDPYAGKWIPIFEVTEDTFKVQVGTSSDTSAHTFVSATTNGLKKKKDKVYDTAVPITAVTATTITINVGSSTDTSTHTFVPGSSLSGAVISGGNYTHTFVSAAENAVVLPVVASTIPNTSTGACADVQSNIDNLAEIVTFYLNQGSLLFPVAIPNELVGVPSGGEAVCKRDLGYLIDGVIGDMRTGGNSNMREVAEFYLDGNGLLVDGLAGEVNESITAFNKARDMMKLAITNQLYEKDFTILPDFLTTSGSIPSSDLTNAIYTEGQFEFSGSDLKLYEAVKEGTTFYSIFFKFVDSGDDVRYSYKLRNILFDGVSNEYELYKLDGSNVVTEADENLLVFIDGVLQIYGESYIIDRTVNPNKIRFYKTPAIDRHFFAYTFSKYKILNNFADQFDSNKKSFELKFGDDNILPPDKHQILVLLDGVPQAEGKAFNIVDNVLTFTEAPTEDKKCHVLYFYGKTFDKTVSIWNGNVFENLEYIGQNSPDGCRYQSKTSLTRDIIFPGDLIKIDGETTKEIIRIDERALENTDNLVYTAFVYTDNSYIRGKNAVANAVVSGTPVSGANPVPISGTVGVTGTMGIPTVFDYQVTGVNITNPGLEYDVAPEVIFKTTCDNPGTGAKAYAEITNGKVTNVVITDGGSGYTAAPELIFAKKYEIIRPHTPLFLRKDIVVDVSLEKVTLPGFNVVNQSEEEHVLPFVVSLSSTSNTTVIEVENKMTRDTSEAGLAYNLQTFDNNKFKYEPLNLNDPLTSYLGTGVTIEHMNRYAPALTIGDFTTHRGVSQGATESAIINIGPEAYIAYGLTLNGAINDAVTTITVTGNVVNFPPTGYLEFGDEIMEYTSISGQDFTVIRGVKSTTASAHADGDYLRLAWRG